MSEPQEFLRPPDVARRLGLSTRSVRELLRARRIKGIKIRRNWLIPRQKLDDLIGALIEAEDRVSLK